jgi:hypothetical protein
MIDTKKNQLVWQGRGTKTIEHDASEKRREQNINYAVKQIFMKYPPKLLRKHNSEFYITAAGQSYCRERALSVCLYS